MIRWTGLAPRELEFCLPFNADEDLVLVGSEPIGVVEADAREERVQLRQQVLPCEVPDLRYKSL